MNELIIKILDTFKAQGINVDLQEAQLALQIALNDYTITPKTYEVALATDIPEKAYYFLSCKKLDGRKESTLRNYMYILKDFATGVAKPIKAITTTDIRIYINEKSKSVKNISLAPVIWCIKSFFTWMQEEEYITVNPARKITVPKFNKNIRKRLSVEEIEACRNACKNDRERAIFEFLLASGCRVSEPIGLFTEDVMSGKFKVTGKGEKERYCFINKKAKVYLKKYIKSRKDSSEVLFVSTRKPYNAIGSRSIEQILADIGKRCGVHLYPHILRHTFACIMLENGTSLTAVQEMLGHEDAGTTQIYAKLSNDVIAMEYQLHGQAA